jgi:NADPH-dependent 2,4-dienoyl-CoA reductase/sulfur reductase-like enzyme/peroxiredoxin family protein/rhodanese-related sulfurtransferase/TusA-related sulfurtransferase
MAKIVIVGGVAGGATTAARLRRLDENAEIVIFERGKYISYANCGLPYYIGGKIAERDKLFVQTPQSFSRRFRIDVRVESNVTRILREQKKVEVQDLNSGKTYKESYDTLVLSPGAEPVKPPLPGIHKEGIFTLRNVHDTDSIKEFIETRHPKRALIVGAGFIGLEMAENLHRLGIFVTIVEMAEQVMTPLDFEMAAEVHQHLKTKKVEFYLKDAIASFSQENGKIVSHLESGKDIASDMVILSIGVRPESSLAKKAGLELGERGGIVVNEYLQTSDPDIYAVGDAIVFKNPIIGRPMITYLAGPANKQGRICADNVAGGNTRTYSGTVGTAIAKVFDIAVASTGVSEKTLARYEIPYISSITHSTSHAGYYPDALPMSVKIVFAPETGKLYGAQIIGYQGVDKRIDIFATILKQGGSVYDLEEVEHAYAPPFASAKDPVNTAGFVAENILQGLMKIVHWPVVLSKGNDEFYIVDVRTPEEYALGTIEGAVNIPLDEVRTRLKEFPQGKKILVFCGMGLRSYLAIRILSQNGFEEVYNLSGGYKTYSFITQKQSNEDIFAGDVIGKDDYIYQASVEESAQSAPVRIVEVDACGLQCPGPIMRLKKEVDSILPGERIQETATDPGFKHDVEAWCRMTRNRLLSISEDSGKITALLEKGGGGGDQFPLQDGEGATLVVFSDDFDKAIASLVIANSAAFAGKKVSMFFTFWGLNLIKKHIQVSVKKDFMGKMFSRMLPKNSTDLKLSKLNMLGLGPRLMRKRMKTLNIDSLEEMFQVAIENGVELIACQMSMDVMGVKKEELIDGVVVGGVATYLGEANQSRVNLFI